MSKEVWKYKRQAMTAARQLGYSETILNALHKAMTEEEVYRIMNNARRALLYT
jgi:hypothetical protein